MDHQLAKLTMVGCSHRQSALAVRERLAFTPTQTADALAAWRVDHAHTEAVLLSTCNRVELYTASAAGKPDFDSEAALHHLADFHNVPVDEVRGAVLRLRDTEVVRHLFSVAASLDSMVVGEAQILGQVKQAYELAGQVGSTGPVTHHLFQAATRVARRVASETTLHRLRLSIPSVAIADFASRVFERFDDKRVLVLGAGKMAQETLRYLADVGAQQLTILNRDAARAESLAAQWHGIAAPWSTLTQQLIEADLVISTTGSDRPIVTLESFQKQVARRRHQRPLFILDLAVPRDFDPAIKEELGVYLFGLDDLAEACERNRAERAKELPAAEQIVEEETARFEGEVRHRATVPVIARFREGLEQSQAAELERLFHRLPELDERSRREIERFADRLVGKMLHPPLESLRDESQNGSPHGLLEALQRLFQLKD
ncbi:MAG TPA: glutamyl-tRNA reductase [Lacipirellulaceae bacterium]|jgi:glutamyl-tRNA reductase